MRSLVVVLLGLGLAACQGSSSGAPHGGPGSGGPGSGPGNARDAAGATADADLAKATGKELYTALCATCHGADLKGYVADHAPSLVSPTFLESASDDFLKRSIFGGRPGTSMGAYGKAVNGALDDAGLDRLVAYIRSHGAPPKVLPVMQPGDATKGAAIYNQSCKTCHGDQRVRAEGVHLANPAFLAQATDPFLFHAIKNGRPGTKMIGWQTLTDQQIADVVAYVRGFAAQAPKVGMLPAPTGKEPMVIHPKGADPQWKPRDGRFVSVDDVAKAYKQKRKMIIIDARPPSDWMRVHITGAVSIPYHDVARFDAVPKDAWVVAYCACPHHLSGVVVDELKKRGHTKAVVLDEGINLWHARGYPVVAAEGVTPPTEESLQHHGHSH